MICCASPTLTDWARTYCARRLGLSAGYADLVQATARQFCEWAGDEVRTDELSVGLITGWLRYLVTSGQCNRVTANGKRRRLTMLWRAAATGNLARPPGLVACFPEPRNIPEAWTITEVESILTACRSEPGTIGEIPARLWWSSVVITIYWTATRIGALLRCRSCDCSLADRWLIVRAEQQKNGIAQLHGLPDQAVAAIAAHYDAARPLIWPWPFHRRTLFNRFRAIVERSGVPCPLTHNMLFHRLRKTSISYQWAVDPVVAQQCAGHSSAATTLAHYVDPRIAPQRSASDVLPKLHF